MFDRNFLLPDSALQRPVSFDTQAFLERVKSPLLHLTAKPTDGSPAVPIAQLLEKIAYQYSMDVRVLLVKLQVEQSLVTQPASQEKLDWAMGFGLTDSERMGAYRGFARQLESAAQALTGYLNSDHPFTVVGLVDQPMKVSDGTVRPRTLATAALYRYTPWIGDRPFGGHVPPFGNYLLYLVWTQFFGSEPQASPAPPDAWRIIAPPENWRQPIKVTPADLPLVRELARRLGLVHREDAAHLKLYLGLPRLEPPRQPGPAASSGRQVTFPSGRSFPVVEAVTLGSEAARYRPARADQAAPLIRAVPEARVSEHFTLDEFMPKDPSYHYMRLSPELVELLEAIRAELGGHPLQVNSGYRPPAYNQLVGGVSNSVHLDGLAADVSSLHVPFDRLAAACERQVGDRGGVGFYYDQQFVHVDLRGERARWP